MVQKYNNNEYGKHRLLFFCLFLHLICLNQGFRNMKKLFLLIGFIAVSLACMYAGPVDQQKAQRLGSRFLSTTAVAQRGTVVQLNLVSAASSRSGVDFYAFNVQGGEGFVIVAGDDRVKPILAYSTTGSYDPQDVSEGFEYMLSYFRSP